jgi:hypothetical protein
MMDFDLAYAEEGMARALALVGRLEDARPHYEKAKAAGEGLLEAEDREIFLGDFGSGDWYGLV